MLWSWSVGYDPNPANLFGETADSTLYRYVNEEGTNIIKRIGFY